jgi:hypothetical protein
VFGILRGQCGARMHWGKAGWPRWAACFDGAAEYPDTWCHFGCAVQARMHPRLSKILTLSTPCLQEGCCLCLLQPGCWGFLELRSEGLAWEAKEVLRGWACKSLRVFLKGIQTCRAQELDPRGKFRSLSDVWAWNATSAKTGAPLPLAQCCGPAGFLASECTCAHRAPCA